MKEKRKKRKERRRRNRLEWGILSLLKKKGMMGWLSRVNPRGEELEETSVPGAGAGHRQEHTRLRNRAEDALPVIKELGSCCTEQEKTNSVQGP